MKNINYREKVGIKETVINLRIKKAATELLNYLDICNQWYSSFKQKAKLPLLKPAR